MARAPSVGVVVGILVLCVFAGIGVTGGLTGESGIAAGSPASARQAPVPADPTVLDSTTRTAARSAGRTLSTQADSTIQLRQELRLTPDLPGEYEADHTYDIPNEVTRFNVTLRDRSTVVASTGFEQTGTNSYAWDGSTANPTLTVAVAANQTAAGTGPIDTGGDYRFVDVGGWALVTRPQAVHGWQWHSGDVAMERTTTVAGEGAAGDVTAFLGPHETYSESAHGQTIRLVVPEAASLAEDPEDVLDSMLDASDSLRVGDRDETVFVVVAPSDRVDWGVRGVQVGDADAWVQDDERLDEPDNVWLHEYVHTRQDYRAEANARWLNEAGATYYAARLGLEQSRISFDEFRDVLDRGTRNRYGGSVLAEPATWENDPNYAVGALVTGELDRQTRVSTDSGASFDRVFARLNERESTVTARDFENHLEGIAGSDVAQAGARYTTTTERPEPWDATQHGTAFGTTPARFVYAFAGEDGESASPFSVTGPYRDRGLSEDRPLEIVTGETLAATVRVANTGEASGDYEVAARVDGTVVASETGRLAPNASATHVVEHRFDAAGEYALSVEDETVTVRVRQPASPNVTGFGADRTSLEPGETVTLAVDVANEAERPAAGSIPVTQNGREIATRSVALDAGETTTLTVQRRLDEPGEYTYGLGTASDRTVTVRVEEPFPTTLVLAGGAAVLVGLLVLGGGIWLYRRRRARTSGYSQDPWEY